MKKVKAILLTVLAIILVVVLFVAISRNTVFYNAESPVSDKESSEAFRLLFDTLEDSRFTYFEYLDTVSGSGSGNIEMVSNISEEKFISYNESQDFTVKVNEAGLYNIRMKYAVAENSLNNATVSIGINGEIPFYEANIIDIPIFWTDETKNFDTDSYGDEALPLQVKTEDPYEIYLYNNTYYTVEPLLFYFEKGNNNVSITNQSSTQFSIKELELAAPVEVPSYEEYKSMNTGNEGSGSLTVNSIDYIYKNSSYISMFSYESPTVNPFDPIDKKLNIVTGSSWRNPGKNITYELNVKEDGYYKLAVHYYPGNDDYSIFRTIRIDGEIPFKEAKAYPFSDVTGNRFYYETISDENGEPYMFYLTEGRHEITLTADYEPVSMQVRKLQLLSDHINQFSLDIRKITGKEVDKNRTWRLLEYLPETESYLVAYDTLIKDIIEELSAYAPNGFRSSTLSNLQKALVKLDKMLEEPDELPLYFEDLYSGSGSVNQMIGNSIETLSEQPMSLNEFTFYTGELGKRNNASFITKLTASLTKFVSSFTSDKYVVRNDDEMLNIWVNRAITHVDTLQKMVDSEFTPSTGIKVKISVMPDANKLILASAAGDAPDIAMGLLSYMPFDLAIRGAAYDLTQFDDFWTVADRFTPGAFVPYVLEDNVYALPETLEFFTTFYRKDIFNNLGLEVPDTWDDVTELLPELQRYGMNFYHPIAGGGSLKWFYQTSPFIYQMGGTIYSDDGLRATIDDENSVKGLEYLAKLFTMYSLPEQDPLFYNSFRYGTLPIGIADFTTYLQIKNAAPELVGKWEMAPYPAMVDAEGNFNRWIIANGRGSIILEDTEKAKEAWEFLKWWSSAGVQTSYSYRLQSIYGPEFIWLSGNLEAVENSSIDIQDKEIILEQVKWLRDVPRTPGQYMLERGISDIWNRSVFNNEPTRIAIDKQIITINREIRRKMIEFGYIDEDGNLINPYTVRDIDWIIAKIEAGKEEE
jgi:ABC-type glycerol-3-phosphate transport system substrate-binding protein